MAAPIYVEQQTIDATERRPGQYTEPPRRPFAQIVFPGFHSLFSPKATDMVRHVEFIPVEVACSPAPFLPISPPLAHEIGGGFGPTWEIEFESCFQESAGNDAAALEEQLRLGAVKEGGEFE